MLKTGNNGLRKDTGGERWVESPHENRHKVEKLGENKSRFDTRFSPVSALNPEQELPVPY